jgi:hypothetical protein
MNPGSLSYSIKICFSRLYLDFREVEGTNFHMPGTMQQLRGIVWLTWPLCPDLELLACMLLDVHNLQFGLLLLPLKIDS